MISSNIKNFLFIIIFALLFCSACNLWKSTSDNNNGKNPDPNVQTSIPFSTKEPEIFQAEIIINSFANDDKIEQKYFIAKKENNSLQTFYKGSQNERSILRTDENKTYLINHQSKTYRELNPSKADTLSNDKLIKTLTDKWLNEKTSTTFEKLETENNITKYKLKFEDSANSEVFIFIDEKLKLPIKQEFYKTSEDKKALTYSMEIKNYKVKVEDKLFELPKDFSEVK